MDRQRFAGQLSRKEQQELQKCMNIFKWDKIQHKPLDLPKDLELDDDGNITQMPTYYGLNVIFVAEFYKYECAKKPSFCPKTYHLIPGTWSERLGGYAPSLIPRFHEFRIKPNEHFNQYLFCLTRLHNQVSEYELKEVLDKVKERWKGTEGLT